MIARPAPAVLAIAGSDPSGGAGLQADLATFAVLGVHGMAVPTCLTVQNARAVRAVVPVAPALVAAQIDAAFAECPVAAVKVGLLAEAGIVEAVAAALRRHRPRAVVLDPVLAATSGWRFLDAGARAALRRALLPLADVLTPNLAEAAALLGGAAPAGREPMAATARALRALGPRAVLLKGGHLGGDESPDVLVDCRGEHWLEGPRLGSAGERTLRGTGCRLSAAIAALLAQGARTEAAARGAKVFVAALLAGRSGGGAGRAAWRAAQQAVRGAAVVAKA